MNESRSNPAGSFVSGLSTAARKRAVIERGADASAHSTRARVVFAAAAPSRTRPVVRTSLDTPSSVDDSTPRAHDAVHARAARVSGAILRDAVVERDAPRGWVGGDVPSAAPRAPRREPRRRESPRRGCVDRPRRIVARPRARSPRAARGRRSPRADLARRPRTCYPRAMNDNTLLLCGSSDLSSFRRADPSLLLLPPPIVRLPRETTRQQRPKRTSRSCASSASSTPRAAGRTSAWTNQARSIHWFPYDRVGVVNADP